MRSDAKKVYPVPVYFAYPVLRSLLGKREKEKNCKLKIMNSRARYTLCMYYENYLIYRLCNDGGGVISVQNLFLKPRRVPAADKCATTADGNCFSFAKMREKV